MGEDDRMEDEGRSADDGFGSVGRVEEEGKGKAEEDE